MFHASLAGAHSSTSAARASVHNTRSAATVRIVLRSTQPISLVKQLRTRSCPPPFGRDRRARS